MQFNRDFSFKNIKKSGKDWTDWNVSLFSLFSLISDQTIQTGFMNWINWFKHIWKLSFGHKSYYFCGHFAAWKSLNPFYYITKSDQGLLQNLPFWVIWKKLERVIYHIYATHGAFCHFGNWQSQFSFNLLCWKEYKGICQKFPFCIIKIKYNHTDWKVNNDSIFIFGLAVYFTPLFHSKLLLSTSSKCTSLWQFCLHVWNSVKTCASVCVCERGHGQRDDTVSGSLCWFSEHGTDPHSLPSH